jgi:hypothetical protein
MCCSHVAPVHHQWVSKARLNRDGSWRLWHYGDLLGDYEYLVIAHNGKCAARLMKSPGEAVAPIQVSVCMAARECVRDSKRANVTRPLHATMNTGDSKRPQKLLEVRFGARLRSLPPKQMQVGRFLWCRAWVGL